MKTKQNPGGYLQFTRKDRIAIIIIALILLTAFLLPPVLEQRKSALPPIADTAWMTALHRLEKNAEPKSNFSRSGQSESISGENYARDRTADGYNNSAGAKLFGFDPNTLDAAGWKKLGIREKTIVTILKYRAKGGKFRKPEDLQRIYGLSSTQYEQLRPYILLTQNTTSPLPDQQPQRDFAKKPAAISGSTMQIDINTADSILFERLPGIGPALAMRIIRFREKLGGFYSIEQVKETFGLADSVFQKIRRYLRNENVELKKMDLNKAGMEELKAHPYVRYNIANVIVRYRDQHGLFTAVEDLKKIAVIDQTTYEKMYPYFFVIK